MSSILCKLWCANRPTVLNFNACRLRHAVDRGRHRRAGRICCNGSRAATAMPVRVLVGAGAHARRAARRRSCSACRCPLSSGRDLGPGRDVLRRAAPVPRPRERALWLPEPEQSCRRSRAGCAPAACRHPRHRSRTTRAGCSRRSSAAWRILDELRLRLRLRAPADPALGAQAAVRSASRPGAPAAWMPANAELHGKPSSEQPVRPSKLAELSTSRCASCCRACTSRRPMWWGGATRGDGRWRERLGAPADA